MKKRFLLPLLIMITGCVTTPPNSQWARRTPRPINDLDSLEMLLQHEQNLENDARDVASSSGEDLRLGMLKTSVQSFLGRPDQIEVAGNPVHGNERWTYVRSVPTMGGYYTEKRVIYFERGNVVGWETQ